MHNKDGITDNDGKKEVNELDREFTEAEKQRRKRALIHFKEYWLLYVMLIIVFSFVVFLGDENQQKLLAQRHEALIELDKEHPNYQKVLDYSHCYYDYHSGVYWWLVELFSDEEYHKDKVEKDIQMCEDIIMGGGGWTRIEEDN